LYCLDRYMTSLHRCLWYTEWKKNRFFHPVKNVYLNVWHHNKKISVSIWQ
jgi:hypothetical protein